jgi:iron complex transport system substrate-binding protein
MDFTPRRIVSLQPSASAILSSIGALDLLVACTKYCEEVIPGISQRRCIVADSWTSKADEILAARPDLVIASVPYQVEALTQILKCGVRFLGLAPKSIADIYADIAAIAGMVGMGKEGDRVIAAMEQSIRGIRDQVERAHFERKLRVFCEEWGKPIIASQHWVAELVEIAGGEFVGEPGKQTTAEAVHAADPEILIAAWCGAGDRVPLEKIIKDRGWSELRAARERQVYCIPDAYLNTPAPTLMAGLGAIAQIIQPSIDGESAGVRRIGDPPVSSYATK